MRPFTHHYAICWQWRNRKICIRYANKLTGYPVKLSCCGCSEALHRNFSRKPVQKEAENQKPGTLALYLLIRIIMRYCIIIHSMNFTSRPLKIQINEIQSIHVPDQ